jgi:hypothetical protein
MALLSQLIRTTAITGRPDATNAWFASRQGGRWAEQTVRAAMPNAARPSAYHAHTLGDLTDLRERGVLTDAEFESLRARLGV